MNDVKEIVELLDEGVDLKKLLEEVSFDLDNFEQANLMQPRLYLQAAKYYTWAVLQKGRTDFALEVRSAELALQLREKLEKVTETRIAQELTTDKEIQTLRKKVYLAKTADVWAKQLLEVYSHRLQVLGNITKIRTGEMSNELRSMKEKAAVKELRTRTEKLRRRISEGSEDDTD